MTKEELKQKYGDEKVLCIPSLAYKLKDNYGFLNLITDIMNCGEFKYRYEVELDESYLQVIPYVVLKSGGKYFITRRLGGDERLRGMVAYLGGHVNPCDAFSIFINRNMLDADTTLYHCIKREIGEEVGFEMYYDDIVDIYCSKVFVDTRQPVSRVHICALVVVDIDECFMNDVQVKETDKLEGGWVTLEELEQFMEQGKMEGWAEIATKEILKLENTREEN